MPATHEPAGPGPADSPGDETTVEDPRRTMDPGAAAESTVDWDALPEVVRQRLAEVAAGAATEMPVSDLPGTVRRVARFTPAKRARLGGSALLAGLRDSPAFRAAVAEWVGTHRSEQVKPGDAVSAAAAAVLLGEGGAGQLLAEVARRSTTAQLRAERDAALVKVDRLAAENRRLRRELDAAREAEKPPTGVAGEAEIDRLRSRLREQGVRLRQALDRADDVAADRDAERTAASRALAAALDARNREQERADVASRRAAQSAAEAEAARQAAREARAADEVRLALLVDTVAGAARGLRRELALGDELSTSARPADLVAGASPPSGVTGRADDPAGLDRLLALPAVHLLVDGYNVTKTGYPDLTLSDQRDRLIAQLAALAARTGAEVTVVFDGAAVVAVPATDARGVRVLFSDPGVLADDVIRALVAAEPRGRPMVVATSDRAVADWVRRRGAHSVASAVLLARLARS